MTDTTPKEETPRCERCGSEMEEVYTRTVDADGSAEVAWGCSMGPEQCELMATLRDGVVPHSALREAESTLAALRSEVEALRKRNEELAAELEQATADLQAEIDGALDYRSQHGARDHETMAMFMDRIAAERNAAESRAQEAETKLRAAEDQVVVLSSALHTAQWAIARAMLKGCDEEDANQIVEEALARISTLAAQRKREIQREALEDAWERVIAATVTLISDGHTQELLQAAILNPEGPDANTEGA